MEIIEIKGNKESKSRYKAYLCGLSKQNDGSYLGFLSVVENGKRKKYSDFDIKVIGRNKEKVLKNTISILKNLFPPEDNLKILDLTDLDGGEKHG